jgi:hypothetical protein
MWEGDAFLPMSGNLWLYAYGNPVNLTDPSGNKPLEPCTEFGPRSRECKEQILSNWSDEKRAPPYISWNPAIAVPPAKIKDGTRVVPSGEQFSQKYACGCSGACGIVALASIFRTQDPDYLANDLFLEAKKIISPNYTYPIELLLLVRAQKGWGATMFMNNEDDWSVMNGFAELVSFSEDWTVSTLGKSLQVADYPIAGVRINGDTGHVEDPGTTGHWVVVTAMSNEWRNGSPWRWIRIMNPFDNEKEYYRWEGFWRSWYLESKGTRTMIVVSAQP